MLNELKNNDREKTSSKNSERIAYTEQYASLESSLSKDWSSMSLKTLKKRTSPLAFVIYSNILKLITFATC